MHEDQGPALRLWVDFTRCLGRQLRVWKLLLALSSIPAPPPSSSVALLSRGERQAWCSGKHRDQCLRLVSSVAGCY